MMIVLLLLGVPVCLGISDYYEKEYGNTYKIKLHRRVHSITFIPKYSTDGMILWKRDDPRPSEDSRRKLMGVYYVINNLTQRDSGRYITSDKDQKMLSTVTIEVIASKRFFTLSPGQELSFSFDLEPNSCNIYFFPENDHDLRTTKTEIVRGGKLQRELDIFDCGGFNLLEPCGILNEVLQMSCSGYFEVRDQNDDKALVVSLHMESQDNDPSHLVITIGVVLALFCCCCVRSCCCGTNSSREDSSETAAVAAEPAVSYHEYHHEPVSPRPGKLHQPSGAATGPLIHHRPTVNVPPAYSKASVSAEQGDAATVPLRSDPEPRFELKGMTFSSASPLTSNSTYCDVYTSDKLNSL